jgi:hypothetical protein
VGIKAGRTLLVLRREDEADTPRPLELRTQLEPPEASPRVEAVRKIDCSTRHVTLSTNADVATAGAETADARDVVGRRELETVIAGELEVGVELVDVAMVFNFREENGAVADRRKKTELRASLS